MNENTENNIRDFLKRAGYELVSIYLSDNMWNSIRVIIKDEYGYKYDSFYINIKNKGQKEPHFVDIRNPFSIENIKLWILLENKPFKLCDEVVEYEGQEKNLDFICLENGCGEIFSKPWRLIYRGQGCPYCSGHRVGKYNNLEAIFPSLLKEWDYNKNILLPTEITMGSDVKVFWICEYNHSWKSTILKRLDGRNCPKCKMSNPERRIMEYLISKDIRFVYQKPFSSCKSLSRPLPFDFYLSDYGLCVEYNGEQHYEPVDFSGRGKEWSKEALKEQKKRDKIKVKYCKDNNIPLLIIPYWDFNNIETILEQALFE
mgnify:CR=1 FL=1